MDSALLVLVASIWGLNFVPIRLALDEVPPFTVAALRFFLAAVPLAFFVPRPKVPVRLLILYGLCIGVVQFGFLFLAIHAGLAAGLASLLMQMQLFFTVGLAAVFAHEKVHQKHVVGGAVSALGLGILGFDRMRGGATASLVGLLLVTVAAFGWSAGNIVAKSARQKHDFDMFQLTVWSSLVSPIPLALLALALDPAPIASVRDASPVAWASIAFMAWVATLVGYGTWNRMLHRYPAALVVQFTMIVPIAGLAGASVFLHETLSGLEWAATLIIFLGVGVGVLWKQTPAPAPVQAAGATLEAHREPMD